MQKTACFMVVSFRDLFTRNTNQKKPLMNEERNEFILLRCRQKKTAIIEKKLTQAVTALIVITW